MKEEKTNKGHVKKLKVPIFTEEYYITVFIGKRDELIKAAAKYTTYSPKTVEFDFKGRGLTYNCFPELHPLILVDGDLPHTISIPTLAHEASHALDYIQEYLGMDDKSGEFRAHGISAILRAIYKII